MGRAPAGTGEATEGPPRSIQGVGPARARGRGAGGVEGAGEGACEPVAHGLKPRFAGGGTRTPGSLQQPEPGPRQARIGVPGASPLPAPELCVRWSQRWAINT